MEFAAFTHNPNRYHLYSSSKDKAISKRCNMEGCDDFIRILLDRSSSIEGILQLVKGNPLVLRKQDKYGNLPIHIECSKQCRPQIIRSFIDIFPESLMVPNMYGYRPLHEILSAKCSSLDIALMMIRRIKRTVEQEALNGDLPLHIECATNARYEVIAACIQLYPLGLSQPNLMENRPLDILLQNKLCSSESAFLILRHKNSDGDLPIHTECSMLCRYKVMLKAIELYPESLVVCNKVGRFPLLLLLRNRKASVSTVRMVIDKYVDSLKSAQIKTSDLPTKEAYLSSDVQSYLSRCSLICPKSLVTALSLGYLGVQGFFNIPCLNEDRIIEIAESYPNILKLNGYYGNLIHVECSGKCRENVLSTFIRLSPESLSMVNNDGELPLHVLLRSRSASLAIVTMMIDAYEEALLHPSKSLNLPIHIECLNGGRHELLVDMITRHLDVLSVPNGSGTLPLHCLLMNTCSSIESVQLLLMVSPHDVSERKGSYALHIECSHQCRSDVISQLIDLYPDAIREFNHDGLLPIHLVLKNRSSSIASLHIFMNTSADAARQQDRDGNDPLHLECSYQCRSEVISQLIKLWPDALYKANHAGLLPLHLVVRNQSSIPTILLAIDKCRSALHRKDKYGHLPITYEINYGFRLEVVSKFIELHPPYLATIIILLAQETVSWPKVLAQLNPTTFLSFYPVLFKWLAAYPARLPSLLSMASLINDAFCLRLILNKYPSAPVHPISSRIYHDYNWQARSKVVLLLTKIRAILPPSATERPPLPEAYTDALSEKRDSSLDQSNPSAGLVVLSKFVRISSSIQVVSNNNHAALQVCTGDDVGDCLLRQVVRFL
jgi:ankyrin repeat protein